ncbi:MAG: TonB-dependent receptor [Chitinophaga sp.]|uniref:SusC/RagA family TonB-linked outer membrane protein n=1 Tax=Chitinophaga sp. TaxID=1869181 RepID=UPI001B211630|nr:TonB-dependent receptor [Chitinophaga sp.]MBO9732680.1 TonB-dependent receptor [Chitinophaga sp.]
MTRIHTRRALYLHVSHCCLLLLMGMLLFAIPLAAQTGTISGRVNDEKNNPLPGVTVTVKGTTTGVQTNAEGQYVLKVPGTESVLLFSAIGYTTQEIRCGGRTVVNVSLAEVSTALGEVVVVGYGTQKRVNLTGAVATINGRELEKQPVANLTNSIAGRLPGVIATNPSGKPGSGSILQIRGLSTLNDNTPLIVVDGVVRNTMEDIDPADVASFSVLKDASAAAVYGARAANGVFLITTKRGRTGKPTISYSGMAGIQQPTGYPKIMSPYDYALFRNQALKNQGSQPVFTDAELADFKSGKTGTDWYKETFRKNSPQTKHHLSVNGGSGAVRYFASLGYTDQEGMYRHINYRRYNFRANMDADITKTLTVSINLSGEQGMTSTPGYDEFFIFAEALRTRPDVPAYTPHGRPFNANGPHPVQIVDGSGYRHTTDNQYAGTISFEQQLPFITKGLSLKGMAAVIKDHLFDKYFSIPYLLYNEDNQGNVTGTKAVGQPPALTETYTPMTTTNYNISLNYARTFDRHTVGALLLYEQYGIQGDQLQATKADFPNTLRDELYYSGPANQSITGTGILQDARRSVVGRVNYAYHDKYLLEGSFRYDGSYRFPADHRFGFFPGISAGWRISEESFFKNASALSFVNNLKLRVSRGVIGNDRVSAFQFQDIYNINSSSGPVMDGKAVSSLNYGVYPNTGITWEKQDNNNIGLDAELWKGLLGIEFDYFSRVTKDILWSRVRSVPATFGRSLPAENYAQMKSHGWELSLYHHNNIGPVNYDIRLSGSFATNKVTQIDDPANALDFQKQMNRPLGFVAGYHALGIFKSQKDADNWYGGTQFGQHTLAGDIQYADLNNDGKIDAKDQEILSPYGNTPRIMYGLAAGLGYKGFDLHLLIQGAAQRTFMLQGDARTMFTNSEGNSFAYLADSWTADNPNARFPLAWIGGRSMNNRDSEIWLRKAGYARLKSIDLGYNFAHTLLKQTGIQRLRLYVSAFNLFTWSQLKEFDPEAVTRGAGGYYPQQKNFNAGIDLTF